MYTTKNNLITHKTMVEADFLEMYEEAEAKARGPIALHMRIATSGGVNMENCHPFVRGDVGIMHNGIIDVPVPKKSPINDTQVFINMALSKGYDFKNKEHLKYLENFVGTYNKLVVMSPDGVDVLNKEQGFTIFGNWFSNINFMQ